MPGKEILLTGSFSIRSFSQLREAVDFTSLDPALFALLEEPGNNRYIYQFFLSQYFGISSLGTTQPGLFDAITEQILHEPAAVYRQLVGNADKEARLGTPLKSGEVLRPTHMARADTGKRYKRRLTAEGKISLTTKLLTGAEQVYG